MELNAAWLWEWELETDPSQPLGIERREQVSLA